MNKEINVMSLSDNVRKWERADKEVSQANKESSVPGMGITGHPGEAFQCGDMDTYKGCGVARRHSGSENCKGPLVGAFVVWSRAAGRLWP